MLIYRCCLCIDNSQLCSNTNSVVIIIHSRGFLQPLQKPSSINIVFFLSRFLAVEARFGRISVLGNE